MKIHKLLPVLAMSVLVAAMTGRVNSAVQEVVTSFAPAISGPTRGGLAKGPDGFFWGTTSGGSPTGDGAIIKVSPAGNWQTVLTFNNSGTVNRGRGPRAGLIDDGNGFLWGSTAEGGTSGFGTLFKVNAATGVLTTLHHCTNFLPNRGTAPSSTLAHDGRGFLWGTMTKGGTGDNGTIFKIGITTGTFVPVAEFTGDTGAVKGSSPYPGLSSDGGDYLWGCTQLGGINGVGTIYKVHAVTGAVTTVVEFSQSGGAIKGFYPSAEMLWDPAGYLWGTTSYGGASGFGTLFKLNAATGQLQTIVEFTGTRGAAKGDSPYTKLETDGLGNLWGTTPRGGSTFGTGTVFKLNMATGAFTTVVEFPETDGAIIGKSPGAALVHVGGGVLLGTTSGGGGDPTQNGRGTVFKINAATGQLTTLIEFTDAGSADIGREPAVGVTEGSGGVLWGVTRDGGRLGAGTVFKVDPATGTRTTLLEFTGRTGNVPGTYPLAALRSDGQGNLWGTTQMGGANDRGTLFKIAEATGTFTSVLRFGDGGDTKGIYPIGSLLVDSSGIFWGTAGMGGSAGRGTIYRFDPAASTLEAVLHFSGNGATNKGSTPSGALHDDGAGFLWGTTYSGGASDLGTVFKVAKTGFALTTMASFTGFDGAFPGANPSGRLVDDGAGFLWGTTTGGNIVTFGSVFKIAKATGAFTHMVSFSGNGATFKGRAPRGGLTPDGQGYLWGVTQDGGPSNWGTVFRIQAATGQFATMLTLDTAGTAPRYVDLLKLADGNFYGTAAAGGPGGAGSVFRVRLGPTPVTLPATSVTATGATLNGTVNANGTATNVRFEYGTHPALEGASFVVLTGVTSGATPVAFNRPASGLTPKTRYYFRITGQNAENAVRQNGPILSFTTPGNDAALSGLSFAGLTPAFAADTTGYVATLPNTVSSSSLSVVPRDAAATIRINGTPVAPGTAVPLDFPVGNTLVRIVVTAEDGVATRTYTLSVTRLPETFVLAANNVAPLTTTGFSPTGHAIQLQLAAAPQPGRTIKVVENSGLPFIQGTFGNLQHGQEVVLQHEGRSYAYIANYYGGSGNDLTLHWKVTDLATWGDNEYGQLGNGNNTDGLVPARITREGSFTGKTVIAVSSGSLHALALCSDGTVSAWGDGFLGKIGDGAAVPRAFPVAVNTSGVLAGKTVVAIVAGGSHSLALCSDGTVAAWGSNSYGQLGDNLASGGFSTVPVAVDRTGALAGKQVVAISAGAFNNLALCSDGTVVAWGDNNAGQSGNGSIFNNHVPVAVQQTGVLAGKQVIAISASGHCLALCSDGTIAAWGYNAHGQLGSNSTTSSNVPVLVRVAGALVGRTPVAIAAGDRHSLALCSDGTMASWGVNGTGQLGDGSTTTVSPFGKLVPVTVNAAGVLAGKSAERLNGALVHSLVACSDGTLATWGQNTDGQLGNNSTANSPLPVAVSLAQLPLGSRIVTAVSGPRSPNGIAIVGLVPPSAITLAAGPLGSRTAVLHGKVSPNGTPTTVSFQLGQTTSYGLTVFAIPENVDGAAPETAISGNAAFLQPATTYHFRIRAANASGTAIGEDMTFTMPNDNAFASSISAAAAPLSPSFEKTVTGYFATVPFSTPSIAISVATEDPRASATINGTATGNGGGTSSVDLPVGTTLIPVVVTAEDRTTTLTYILSVTRLPAVFSYSTGNEVPVSTGHFTVSGIPAAFELNYAPAPGTTLTVARSTGLEFVGGRFSNLAQGQLVVLTHGGVSYRFVANYYGGSGNDLVLQWADTALHGWGANANGQLGVGDGTKAPWPAPSPISEADHGTILATAAGYLHTLALAADGKVLAWGYNAHGELGDGTKVSRPEPAPLSSSGALAGKRVIAISAGSFHNLALCDDGTLAAWGYNNHGQLGNGTAVSSTLPVAVDVSGALAGKTVVSVSAGAYHSLALCSDGSVAAWGFNGTGSLGNNTTTNSPVPVSVRFAVGPLVAMAISAGQYHNLAIRDNGLPVSWGYNLHGQLGTGDTLQKNRATPVVNAAVLSGRFATAVAAGGSHSLVLLDDGSIAAWGLGTSGQLGDGGTATQTAAVLVRRDGVLASRQVTAISAGDAHGMARCSDGTLVAWGSNAQGQLGTGNTVSSPSPVNVTGMHFMTVVNGASASHSVVPVALAPAAALATGAIPGSLPEWRFSYFGRTSNDGDSADDEDPDRDGVPNLVEFAFGLDPSKSDAGSLPAVRKIDGHLVIAFTERPGIQPLIYGASTTRDFLRWESLPDTGIPPFHEFRLPLDRDRGFMRLEIESE